MVTSHLLHASGLLCGWLLLPGRVHGFPLATVAHTIALMRRKIIQGDVEMLIETFLGSLWESRTNVAITLLEVGLAKLQTSFGSDRIPDFYLLEQAKPSAQRQKLKSGNNLLKERRYPTVQQFASLNTKDTPSRKKRDPLRSPRFSFFDRSCLPTSPPELQPPSRPRLRESEKDLLSPPSLESFFLFSKIPKKNPSPKISFSDL
ncbi:hypothetical protein VNO77_20452 [Canavalia gladiata]|uniref:Uncharacterized protein n=1 Tax=Canavalia gladiata TaxID=3824 RepID=A0AAN9QJD1_CANGL